MLKPLLVAASLLLATTVPDLATVQQIERSVRLPRTARPIDQYDRYYAPEVISGRGMIVGLYLSTHIADDEEKQRRGDRDWWRPSAPRKGRLRLLARAADLPGGIMDGGCEQIRVVWDVATAMVAAVSCNGYA